MTEQPATPPAPAKKRGCLFWGLCGLGGLVVLSAIGSMGDQEKRAERQAAAGAAPSAAESAAPPPIEVTATELQRAYAANEVAAKAQYGGKRLRVTGTVRSIDLDITDDPVLVLATADDFEWVRVQFEKADSAAIAKVAKGQKVAVLCDRVTEAMGTPLLSQCAIAQ